MARHVLLVGGGHANVQVLRLGFADDTRVTLVSDRPASLYSGMVPGLIAGAYRESELSIDLAALCRATGARFRLGTCTAIRPAARTVVLADGEELGFDVAGVDVGSRVSQVDVPGVAERALPTRPLAELPERVRALLAEPETRERGVAVVGGGAGGVELALALRARLGPEVPVTLVERSGRLLSGAAPRVGRRAARACRRRGVAVALGSAVVAADAGGLELEDGRRLAAHRWVWVTGPAAPPLFDASGLSTDAGGFLRVGPTLQSPDCPELLAAGDCVALDHAPDTPRAGVHAVRAGPVLHHNLVARLRGAPLRVFRPQRDFLSLLDLGDGTALGTKWGLCVEGRAVAWLKRRIDRAFVATYQC